MSDSSRQSSPADSERVWGLCVAIAFGSFFLLFLTGLVFPNDPDTTALDYILLAVLTTWCGAVCAGGIAMLLRRQWGERVVESSLGIGAVALFGGMVGSTCWQASQQIVGRQPAARGDGLALVLALLWAGFGSLLAWSECRRKEPSGIASSLLLWPFLVLLRAPGMFAVLFALLLLFVGGGDRLGSEFGHPYLGATTGLACLVALFAALARLSRRWV